MVGGVQIKAQDESFGVLGTAVWLVSVLAVFIIGPVLIASWLAEQVYPLPNGPRNGNALGNCSKNAPDCQCGTWPCSCS